MIGPEEWARLVRLPRTNTADLAHVCADLNRANAPAWMLRLVQIALRQYSLTPAETSVAVYVVLGDVDAVIAIRRHVKPGTVRAQVCEILRKADAADRAEFISRVLNHALWLALSLATPNGVCRHCARRLPPQPPEGAYPATHDPRQ